MRSALFSTLLLLACGPQTAGESSTSGAGDTGSTASTTPAPTSEPPTTSAPTTGSTTSPPTSTTDEPVSCDMFLSDELGPAVTITLVHDGSAPVWVPSLGCGGSMPRLKILDTDLVDFFAPGFNCFPIFCDEFMQLDSCELSCDDCSGPSNVRIDPGAKFVIFWPGGRAEELEMTAECAAGRDCQRACVRAQQAHRGAYEFVLPAFRACTGACECEAENGLCPLPDPSELSQPIDFKATILYPQMDAVDLQITD